MCAHGVNDFIEVEEESGVSLGTSDEPKPIPQSCHHTLEETQTDTLGL